MEEESPRKTLIRYLINNPQGKVEDLRTSVNPIFTEHFIDETINDLKIEGLKIKGENYFTTEWSIKKWKGTWECSYKKHPTFFQGLGSLFCHYILRY